MLSQQNWGYLTRSNLELGILIISGFCKKTVYQYVQCSSSKNELKQPCQCGVLNRKPSL
jgi:hypothetical protein